MTPCISVIVPVYNAEKYLRACVDSILSQSYPAVQAVLVDDGSTDGSPAICDSYRDDGRVRVIHTENRGVSCARNTGLDHASGEYIAFLDADDAFLPDALTIMYRLIADHGCDIAACTKRSYRPDGSSFKTEYPEELENWSGRQGTEASLCDHPATYSVWGKLFCRSAIGEIRFEEGRRIHEDSYFIFECMLREPRVTVSNTETVRYNISDNSASRDAFSDKYYDILYFAEKKKEQVAAEAPELAPLAENMLIKAHMALLKKLTLSNDPRYKETEKSSLRYVREHRRAYIPSGASDNRLFRYILFRLYYPRKLILLKRKR